jgi:hypothetical protein
MKFLDYKSIENFSQISEWFVRPTDGLNQECATFFVRAHNTFIPHDKNVRVLVRVIPTYVQSEFYITYDTGKQRFERVLFKPNLRLISKLQLRIEQILNIDLLSDVFERRYKNALVFEKIFAEIPTGATMNVTSIGTNPPLYTEPVTGKALPLWHIGGRLDNNIDKVESVFIFPRINAKLPTSAEIVLIGLSDITDPDFPSGSRFICLPRELPPWNLSKCIERGEIVLQLDGSDLKSSHIESYTTETAVIVFKER